MDVVLDVESYPEFINFVSNLRKLTPTETEDDRRVFQAEMSVGYKMFNEKFVCSVIYWPTERRILVRENGTGGALRKLKNEWHFHELSNGSTLVDFVIDVKLKNPFLEMLAEQKFQSIADKVMDVFIRRAGEMKPRIKGKVNLTAEALDLGLKRV